jgi:hypothetical protein
MLQAVDARLAVMDVQLATAQSNTPLPEFNQTLQTILGFDNGSGPHIDPFKTIERELQSALGQWSSVNQPSHAQLIASLQGAGLNPDSQATTVGTDFASITIHPSQDLKTGPTFQTTLGLSLPAVPFVETDSSQIVTGRVGFDYNQMTFGIVNQNLFTYAGDGASFSWMLAASINGSANGRLGFLPVSISGGGADFQLQLGATVSVANSSPSLTGITLGAPADILNVHLQANFPSGAAFPSLSTNLIVTWPFSQADPNAARASFGSQPTVTFQNVTMNLGSSLTGILGPVASDINDVLKAGGDVSVSKILDVLSTQIPVLSQLSELIGNGPVTLLSLAGSTPDGLNELVGFLNELSQLTSDVAAIQSTDGATVNFGTFTLQGDPRGAPDALDPNATDGDLTSLSTTRQGGAFNLANALAGQSGPAVNAANDFVATKSSASFSFQVPILTDPSSGVMKLLLGQDTNFFTLSAHFGLSASDHDSIPLFGVFDLVFSGALGLDASLGMAYDTHGLRQYLKDGRASDFANGFYVDANNTHVSFSGGIAAGVGINLLIAEADATGGLSINNLGVSVNDPDGDGKLRPDEVTGTLVNALTLTGELDANLMAHVQVGIDVPFVGFVGWEKTWTIATFEILCFHGCTLNQNTPAVAGFGNESGAGQPGELDLYTGPLAGMRTPPGTGQEDENYTIYEGDPGGVKNVQNSGVQGDTVTVEAFGIRQVFYGVTKIYAEGGYQGNQIFIGPGVSAPAVLIGNGNKVDFDYEGTGDATLKGGYKTNILRGGFGNTSLYGGTTPNLDYNISNTFIVGQGNTTVFEGQGNNTTILPVPFALLDSIDTFYSVPDINKDPRVNSLEIVGAKYGDQVSVSAGGNAFDITETDGSHRGSLTGGADINALQIDGVSTADQITIHELDLLADTQLIQVLVNLTPVTDLPPTEQLFNPGGTILHNDVIVDGTSSDHLELGANAQGQLSLYNSLGSNTIAPVTVAGLSSVDLFELDLEFGTNTVNFNSAPASVTIKGIDSGSNDTIGVLANQYVLFIDGTQSNTEVLLGNYAFLGFSTPLESLSAIHTTVDVENATLTLDDANDTADIAPTMTDQSIAGAAPATIFFDQLRGLTYKLGGGSNIVNVDSTPQLIQTTLDENTDGKGTGQANVFVDVVGFLSTLTLNGAFTTILGTNGLQNIMGDVIVNGPADNSIQSGFVNVSDATDAQPRNVTVKSDAADNRYVDITGLIPDLPFPGGDIPLTLEIGSNIFSDIKLSSLPKELDIKSSPTGGELKFELGGNTTVEVHNDSFTLDGFLEPVNIVSKGRGNVLVLDDSENSQGAIWVVGATQIDRIEFVADPFPVPVITAVDYSGLDEVAIYGGSGGNTFEVSRSFPATPMTIAAGNGINKVEVQYQAGAGPEDNWTVRGSSRGQDLLTILDVRGGLPMIQQCSTPDAGSNTVSGVVNVAYALGAVSRLHFTHFGQVHALQDVTPGTASSAQYTGTDTLTHLILHLTNTAARTLTGPLWLVLTDFSSPMPLQSASFNGQSLVIGALLTGEQFVEVPVQTMAAGQTIDVNLDFTPPASPQPATWQTSVFTDNNLPLNIIGTTFPVVEGQPQAINLALIGDCNPSATIASFSAAIRWDDGTSTSATITGSNGVFFVSGMHPYNEETNVPIPITIFVTADNGSGGTTTVALTSAVQVLDAPLEPPAINFQASENHAFTNATVATFQDTNPFANVTDFNATIYWGDGSSSSGTVVPGGGNGFFAIQGSHLYAEDGTVPVRVDVFDDGGQSTTATTGVPISDVPVIITEQPRTVIEGGILRGVLATFTDPGGEIVPDDFSAIIRGPSRILSTAAGTLDIQSDGQDGFQIATIAKYLQFFDEGASSYSVSVTDIGGAVANFTVPVQILDGPITVSTPALADDAGNPFTPTAGASFYTTVDKFFPHGLDFLVDLTVTVNWGDGQVDTVGTNQLSFDGAGGVIVRAGHTYAAPGTYALGVSVVDDGGQSASGTGLVTVAGAPGHPADFSMNLGALSVLGGGSGQPGDSTIAIDTNSLGGVLATINGDTVSFLPGGVTSLILNGGNGNDLYEIEKLPAGVPLIVNLGSGTNQVVLSPIAQNLDAIASDITINGGPGLDNLILNDQANSRPTTWTINEGSLSRQAAIDPIINFNSLSAITINAGLGSQAYNWHEDFVVHNPDGTIAERPGHLQTLNLHSQAALNALNVFDENNIADTVLLSGNSLITQVGFPQSDSSAKETGTFDIQFPSGLVFHSTSGATINVLGNPLNSPTTVKSGGSNTVSIGGGSLGSLLSSVNLNSDPDTLIVDDSATTTPQSYTVTASSVLRTGAAPIYYTGLASLTVDGGSGGNSITVKNTAAGTNTLVNSGNGVDVVWVEATTGRLTVNTQQSSLTPTFNGIESVNVGTMNDAGNSLDTIQGAITVTTAARPNLDFVSLGLFDNKTAAGHAYTVTRDTILRSGAAPIHYYVTNQVFLYLAQGSNNVNVTSAVHGLPVVFIGGVSSDVYNVGDAANTLNDINQLTFAVANPGSKLILHDEGNSAALGYTFSAYSNSGVLFHRITRSDWSQSGADIYYTGPLQSVELDAGSGADTFSVQATGAPTIIRGSGPDLANLGVNGTVQGILAPLTIDNIAASTAMTVDDSADPTGRTVTLTPSAITGLSPAAINYGPGVSSLTIDGGYGGNAISVQNTALGTSTTINSGNGVDVVDVSATTGPLTVNTQQSSVGPAFGGFEAVNVGVRAGVASTLDGIQGPLTVNTVGRLGIDYADLEIYDSAATAPEQFTITNNTILRSGAAPIHYTVTNELDFFLGSGGDTVNLESTSPLPFTWINGGVGNDTFNVGDLSNTLNGIGYVGVIQVANPGSRVILNDQGNTANLNYNLAATVLHRTANLSFPAYRLLRSDWDPTAHGQQILLAGPLQTVTLNAGSGQHTFNVQSLPVNVSQVSINGTGSADTLIGPNQNNTWQITSANVGNLDGMVGFAGMQNLTGGMMNDLFQFSNGGALSGVVAGGGGFDALDFSRYRGNIAVDLALHQAYAANQRFSALYPFVAAISNVENVTGSIGNDLIVGDAAANTLLGGTGRNVLIGGDGSDILNASASQDDNILIGGHTDYDQNLQALDAIMAEWTRTDLQYTDRASDLKNGTNSVNATPLNRVNGQLILLNNATVHADTTAAPDTLTGGAAKNFSGQIAHDWYFIDLDDTITNLKKPGDDVTKVK